MKRKSTFYPVLILLLSFFFFQNCKNEKVKEVIQEKAKTNIRFVSIKENFKELPMADRLATNKTEITSQYFQMEGAAWENENVAFRNYFDARNGMDVFGKRTKEMILDSVGIDENYHELQDWGMDILKVGNSLGAGAIGLIIGDSLYRVGSNGGGTYRLVSETPNRSSLIFSFDDWKVKNRFYKILHEVEITAGTHFYKSNISIEGLKGDEVLVSGIVAHLDSLIVSQSNDFLIGATHGKQAIGGESLGMALAVPANYFLKTSKASYYKGEIDHTHLMEMKLENGVVEFYFFAGWELQDERFKDAEYFTGLVKKELSILTINQ